MNRLHYRPAPVGNRLHYGDGESSEIVIAWARGALAVHHTAGIGGLGAAVAAVGIGGAHHIAGPGALALAAECLGLGAVRHVGLTPSALAVRWLLLHHAAVRWSALALQTLRLRAPIVTLTAYNQAVRAAWTPLSGWQARLAVDWTALQTYYLDACTTWPLLVPYDRGVKVPWPALLDRDSLTATAWPSLLPWRIVAGVSWSLLQYDVALSRAEWDVYVGIDERWRVNWPAFSRRRASWRVGLDELIPPPWRWPRRLRWPIPPPLPPKPWGNVLLYAGANTPNTLHYGRRPRFVIRPMTTTVVAHHDVNVRSLPDLTPLACSVVEIASNIDAWTDQVKLTLHSPDDIARLFDDPDTPGEIEIVIDGESWRLLAITYEDSMQWGRRVFTVTAYSLAALLSKPYAVTRSDTEATQKTARQIAEAELAPFSGWSLRWNLPDWLVPAGVFSYQDLAPIEVISLLVKAVGGTLQSHPNQKILRACPVYAISPWEWAGATPAVILISDKLFTQQARQAIRPHFQPYDGIHVAGRDQGVLALVRRQGTLGASQPAMVTDPLITHVDAARERGRAELAALWPQPDVSLTIPLASFPDAPGVVYPGDLLEVRHPDIVWRGQAMSRTISVYANGGVVTVRQNVAFTSRNSWSAWAGLLPESLLQSATIIDVAGARPVATVQMVDGSTMTVRRRNQEVIGQRVFIRKDEIIGDAPTLPYFVLDV